MKRTNLTSKYLILLLAVSMLAGCARYVIHPGAVNKSDSIAYDTLLVSEAVIDHARREILADRLPATLKPGFNILVSNYNKARLAWLAYRNAIKAGQVVDNRQLKLAIEALDAALDSFQNSRIIL